MEYGKFEKEERIMMLIFAIGVGALIYYILKGEERGNFRKAESPEDILREKLARGEIDEEAYRRRMEMIKK